MLTKVCRPFGTIKHLYGSTRCGDKVVSPEDNARCTEKRGHKPGDTVIVQEKLDGGNMSVYRTEHGDIVPLSRSGLPANGSKYTQHHMFHRWVMNHIEQFDFLAPKERLCGEWMILAHGTRYDEQQVMEHPFVVFDLIKEGKGGYRYGFNEFELRVPKWFMRPQLLHIGNPVPPSHVMETLGERGFHGALETVEGAVWRVENDGKLAVIAKYVRAVPGKYLGGGIDIWNIDVKKWHTNEGQKMW